ncbi:MAG: hypothetical protein HDR09_05250 [Lachnospiraceae bacterium]|nr:hypothetical protein [Lachnospiraceae bacterium]
MSDFEHMIIAIDELISHNVAGIICMENYRNCYFPNGFRKVFDSFCKIREDYEKNRERYSGEETGIIERAKFQTYCREEKERLLGKFINELKGINSEIDYEEAVKNYYIALEQEDVQTLEMHLSIYPYLISLIREKEEKVGES